MLVQVKLSCARQQPKSPEAHWRQPMLKTVNIRLLFVMHGTNRDRPCWWQVKALHAAKSEQKRAGQHLYLLGDVADARHLAGPKENIAKAPVNVIDPHRPYSKVHGHACQVVAQP